MDFGEMAPSVTAEVTCRGRTSQEGAGAGAGAGAGGWGGGRLGAGAGSSSEEEDDEDEHGRSGIAQETEMIGIDVMEDRREQV